MKKKVLIVDDEPAIRLILRRVIERNENFEVAGECGSMTDALLAFQESHPDVVFLDVDLQGSSGIDCARVMLSLVPQTKVIFATAYAEYMPSAFELYAFDYLVKPFNIARIEHTLERITSQEAKTGEQAQGMPQGMKLSEDKLMIRGKENVSFVTVDDIIMALRENAVTVIYTENARYETSQNLTELEKKLHEPAFIRSHRSYIINVGKIASIEPYGRWTYVVKFAGIREDALMTKENFDRVKEMFS